MAEGLGIEIHQYQPLDYSFNYMQQILYPQQVAF